MGLEDFASKLRLIVYQLRTGRREQAYASLAVLCLAATGGLSRAPKEPVLGLKLGQVALYAGYGCFALAAFFAAALVLRIWKQAAVASTLDGSSTVPPCRHQRTQLLH